MLQAKHSAIAVLSIAMATSAYLVIAQKASVPKPQDKLALGEKEVEQLLPLMDADKDGNVSREEFMAFMQAEFDRLDKERTGKLDVRQLTQSKPQSSQFTKTGK